MRLHYKKWFVRRVTGDMKGTVWQYEVMQGGFRDSLHYNKHSAEERCFLLNFLEEIDYWNLSDEEKELVHETIND